MGRSVSRIPPPSGGSGLGAGEGKSLGRSVSRILSCAGVSRPLRDTDGRRMDEHLSRPSVTARLMQSTRGSGRANAAGLASSQFPCLTLLRMGVAWPPHCCGAGGLLHRRFTLTGCWLQEQPAARRYVSVARSSRFPHLGGASPLRGLPGILLFGVRTFLDPGLYAGWAAPIRPTQGR